MEDTIDFQASCRIIAGTMFAAFNAFTLTAADEQARKPASALWSGGGREWTPKSRLPDFSCAGYRGGFRQIPQLPVKVNVKEFGAAGDGERDDTAAFAKAVAAVEEGAVLIPAGRYRLTGVMRIRKRGVVLRGEGADATVLYFPKPLDEIEGPGAKSAPGGSWSWSGGMISFEGEDRPLRLALVTAPARRGDTVLSVSTTSAVAPGQWVRLVMADTGRSLARYLYGDKKDIPREEGIRRLVDFVSPVESVTDGAIVLKRAVRTDVLTAWEPEIWAHHPSVQDVGVEDLTIEFPPVRYAGHHDEPGFNAISFEGVSHGWVRRVRIHNADSGIFLRNRTKFCTVESVRFTADPERMRAGYGRDRGEPALMPVGGHHGISIANSADNVVSDFRMDFRFIHDIGVSAWSSGNVYSNGRGTDMSFDHHRRGPYENLFTDIHAGVGTRLWQSGGDLQDGGPSGVRETFWNIRTDLPQTMPSWAVQANFVGITTMQPTQRSEDGEWWESISPEDLVPANLYTAQKDRLRH